MAVYSLDALLRFWAHEQLTTEQAIGQILQIAHDLEQRVNLLERAVASLAAPPPPPPIPPPAPPRALSRELPKPRRRRRPRPSG